MRSNLRTRVITAVVLAVVVIGTLVTGSSIAWTALVTCFCGAAAWEFLRLATDATKVQKTVAALLLATLILIFVIGLFFADGADRRWVELFHGFLGLAAVFWLVIVPWQLAHRSIRFASWPSVLMLPTVVGAAWLAAVFLQRAGARFLLAVVVLTVAADVGGYFVGRSLGRVKLAPSISPGKTREGALGGIAATALWAACSAFYLDLCSGLLPLLAAALVGAFLGACAAMGDLWESQLKRQAGVKDSSQLLPGHGGVLDRIDAQLAVLPLATLSLAMVKPIW